MPSAYMVCMYGKILTSILELMFTCPGRPACDWVYMCVVYACLYTNELIRWRSGQ